MVAVGRVRSLFWKAPLAIISAVAIAAAAEAWHTAWNSCSILTGFGRASIPECIHPGGFTPPAEFWWPHFEVLLGASIVTVLTVLGVWEILVWRFSLRLVSAGRETPGTQRWGLGAAEAIGLGVPGVAFATSLLALGLVPLGTYLDPFTTRADLADPWWGIRLIILLTIAPVGAVFALTAVARLFILGSGYPVLASLGVSTGALFGYLALPVFLLVPILTPLFAYAAYLLGYLGAPGSSLSRGGASLHLISTSAAFVPLAILGVTTLLFPLLISIYIVLVGAILITLRFKGKGRGYAG